jgi:RNA polymerase sigma-70 factor (ECF subfamily)
VEYSKYWTHELTQEDLDPRAEEARLVFRARQGNEDALRVLVDRHRNRLVRVAANILRDSAEAEDVAQEAFLKAFKELHKLRDDRAFPSFLYKICVHLCVDRLRLKRAEPMPLDPTGPNVSLAVETKVTVEGLLRKLPPELAATLVLREIEQLSYEEVAEIMKVPVGTVRSRLHKARAKFRAMWKAENEE